MRIGGGAAPASLSLSLATACTRSERVITSKVCVRVCACHAAFMASRVSCKRADMLPLISFACSQHFLPEMIHNPASVLYSLQYHTVPPCLLDANLPFNCALMGPGSGLIGFSQVARLCPCKAGTAMQTLPAPCVPTPPAAPLY